MKILTNYIRSSFEELSKVVWPTKNQAVKLTIIVLVFCLIVAVVLGVVDYAFGYGYNYLLKLTS
ncbi:preprotein translocase subunit SecE [Candidatus Peregrinibacteria bacterium RIFCSPLOWO2_01_FULL_39_12]|jgi:preprotein translocase subunit SecE|nr:MAG: preprotein translocase subunit SecE [Candidatus Peregrinibacteria bacterium RIFCSPLOWO2_01_FULL_39_12]